MAAALAFGPFHSHATISTTLHCLLERVSSRDWSRKSCHDFQLPDSSRTFFALRCYANGRIKSRSTSTPELGFEEIADMRRRAEHELDKQMPRFVDEHGMNKPVSLCSVCS
jgi:hypothetical protein